MLSIVHGADCFGVRAQDRDVVDLDTTLDQEASTSRYDRP
jgi:hypothetical protein